MSNGGAGYGLPSVTPNTIGMKRRIESSCSGGIRLLFVELARLSIMFQESPRRNLGSEVQCLTIVPAVGGVASHILRPRNNLHVLLLVQFSLNGNDAVRGLLDIQLRILHCCIRLNYDISLLQFAAVRAFGSQLLGSCLSECLGPLRKLVGGVGRSVLKVDCVEFIQVAFLGSRIGSELTLDPVDDGH